MIEKNSKRDYWPEPSYLPPIPEVELIPMQIEHLDEIVRIENESFPIPWSRDAFVHDLNENNMAHYWTMFHGERIIGYAGFWLIDTIAHLTTICVIEDYKGRNLGEWLLLMVMKYGENLGAKRFTLEVRESNIAAIRLYEKVGYVSVGKRVNYYEEIGEDALVMWTGKPPYEC